MFSYIATLAAIVMLSLTVTSYAQLTDSFDPQGNTTSSNNNSLLQQMQQKTSVALQTFGDMGTEDKKANQEHFFADSGIQYHKDSGSDGSFAIDTQGSR